MSSLSGGQRRRLDVAIGLVHAPSILFLDEPSTGLDPQNRANLWSHVLRMRAEHAMTVVLTTHYMDEADAMAERVVVVDHGRVIADDTADRLKADLAGDRVVVTSPRPARRLRRAGAAVARGAGRDRRGRRVEARVADGPRALPVLLAAAQAEGVPVETAQVHRPTLDDVFLTLTGRSLREAGEDEAWWGGAPARSRRARRRHWRRRAARAARGEHRRRGARTRPPSRPPAQAIAAPSSASRAGGRGGSDRL